MVFLPNLGVNLRPCLCGVVNYASAQALDFLDLGQKSAFLDWKRHQVLILVILTLAHLKGRGTDNDRCSFIPRRIFFYISN